MQPGIIPGSLCWALVVGGVLACAPQATPSAPPAGDAMSQVKPPKPVTLTYGILGTTWASAWEMAAQVSRPSPP